MTKIETQSVPGPAGPPPDERRVVDDRAPEPIAPKHRAAVLAGLADMHAGRVVDAAEMEAVYARFGRSAP